MDNTELGKILKAKRKAQGLSLVQAGQQIGVSASSINRMEAGIGGSDMDTILLVQKWLNVPFDPKPVLKSDMDSLTAIEDALKKDKDITPRAARALGEMMKVAYNTLAKA